MIEQRQVRIKLLTIGRYSKALVLPRWWLRLNGDPDAVDINLSLGFIAIQPVRKEGAEKEAGGGKQQ